MQGKDFMGTAEVAQHLGVTRRRELQLLASEDLEVPFPPPVAVLSSGKIWDGRAIRRWATSYTPRKRR